MSTASLAQQCVVEVAFGTVLIRNANTTIGYCRFTQVGDIEYIFVNPMYRRSGYGRRLLEEVRNTTGRLGRALEPISPLGRRFFASNPAPIEPAALACSYPDSSTPAPPAPPPLYGYPPMKAFLIDPASKRIAPVEFDGSRQALQALIGFATIDSDEIDANGDRLFFDEECFLRAVPGAGRFQIDTLAPVAGRGVIVGSNANGAELAAPAIDADALAARIRFV